MFFKIVVISILCISYGNGLNITEPQKRNIIGHENYLDTIKEDFGLDYAEKFSRAVSRQKRSHHECKIENLVNLNSACTCQSGSVKTMVELKMINGDMSGSTLQMPRCIVIDRCTSSCPLPTHKCVATNKTTIKIPVSVIRAGTFKGDRCETIEVEKHLKCGCDCAMTEENCQQNQLFDEQACKCRCKLVPDMCPKPKKPNKMNCECECPKIKQCSSGSVWDEDICQCIVEDYNDVDFK